MNENFFGPDLENMNLGDKYIKVLENGTDISFSIEGDQAFLQCDVDHNTLIARTIVVEQKQQGFGTKLFLGAMEYAKSHNMSFVTDYGISEAADHLIQSLIKKGYNFIKNPDCVEKQGNHGKRIVTFDGSPVYRLKD